MNLTAKAGKSVALVGQSGSGKSTIVSLVERYYDPLAGTVCLDGVPLQELDLVWLRDQAGDAFGLCSLFSLLPCISTTCPHLIAAQSPPEAPPLPSSSCCHESSQTRSLSEWSAYPWAPS